MLKKGKLVVVIFLVLFFITIEGQSQAALQSNPNTYYTKPDSGPNWMVNIRNMETTGQAMGLNETINGSSLVSTSASNGIDVHMMKTTEYGAIAILSASGYGNPQVIQSGALRTTTGNKTGIYYALTTWEYSANCIQGSNYYTGVDGRYYNTYTTSISSARVGDGMGNSNTPNPGCTFWHSAPYANWYSGWYSEVHGYGSIFTYSICPYTDAYYGRGVAVCGTGL